VYGAVAVRLARVAIDIWLICCNALSSLDIDAVDIRRKIFGLDLLPSREAIPTAPLHGMHSLTTVNITATPACCKIDFDFDFDIDIDIGARCDKRVAKAACEGDNEFLTLLFLLNGANANNSNKYASHC
jgi:hypothetical protein